MDFNLNEKGEVIETFTFGDYMRALGHPGYKKKKKNKDEPKKPPVKGMLIIDIPEDCWHCPCCDNEMCYCTVIEGCPDGSNSGRLKNCPIRPLPDGIDI